MRIKLSLSTKPGSRNILPVNYQYPLSSAIYKIISQADEAYATFLHEQGYRRTDSLKTFKLFTFSDINTPFDIKGDRLLMKTEQASLVVCFHVPQAATNFVKGLFIDRQIDIADQRSKVTFLVSRVEILPLLWSELVAPEELKTVVFRPVSPMVVAVTNDNGYYDFLGPNDNRFIPALIHHVKEKYRAAYGEKAVDIVSNEFNVTVLKSDKLKSRLITIKADTPEENKIRGYVGFQLQMRAPAQVLELIFNAGIGVYGSMGFGCVECL